MTASYDGWEFIYHSGYFPPYHTLMSLFPGKRLGIFTSTNEGPAKMEATIVHLFIFELLRGNINAKETSIKLSAMEKALKAEKEMKREKALHEFFEAARETEGILKADEIIEKYGSSGSGDVEIMEKLNEQTNATGLYVSYGQWAQGWMENIGGSLYQITWATDLVQDHYATGDSAGYGYAMVENETLAFVMPSGEDVLTRATFKLGVSLATLPPIPWSPGSCGPETK